MKKTYKVINWKQYNQALKQRGSLAFWLADDLEGKWYEADLSGKGTTGMVADGFVR
jgi:hypothetical protein